MADMKEMTDQAGSQIVTQVLSRQRQEPPWLRAARAAVLQLAAAGQTFDVNQARNLCTEPPSDCASGSVISAAARGGLIERVGSVRSSRAERHGALVGVWRGV